MYLRQQAYPRLASKKLSHVLSAQRSGTKARSARQVSIWKSEERASIEQGRRMRGARVRGGEGARGSRRIPESPGSRMATVGRRKGGRPSIARFPVPSRGHGDLAPITAVPSRGHGDLAPSLQCRHAVMETWTPCTSVDAILRRCAAASRWLVVFFTAVFSVFCRDSCRS